ncbi:MAG TPA: hypothetical protein VMD75_00890 [Candidatus Binataceae bacterium]|nr:hypothetical protein [Candidatus Binataceae bacterium]
MYNAAFDRLVGRIATLTAFSVAAAALAIATPVFAQTNQRPHLRAYSIVMPLRGATRQMARSNALASTTVPMWDFTITASRDNNTYSGSMVGRSPFFHGARTTNIQTYIVPLIIQMPAGGIKYDPTVNNTCAPAGAPLTLLQQSPIVDTSDFTMNGVSIGTAQYVDAFQRANFWTNVEVTGNRYHTVLSPVTTLSAVTVSVPSGKGISDAVDACGHNGNLGILALDWFQSYLEDTLIPSLAAQGVGPTSFPIFLMNDVVMSEDDPPDASNCCVLGYHGAFGLPTQMYAPVDFDTTKVFSGVSDTSVFAHEVAEFTDDPLGTNPTPLWGHVGQVSGCQNNLEVGDPLTGTLFPAVKMPNGTTYNLQELAFFSWFFSTPSIGAGGLFSDNGTFTSDAGSICS